MTRAIKTTTRSFRITDKMSEDIEQLAEQSARHASEVIRDALRWYLRLEKSARDVI